MVVLAQNKAREARILGRGEGDICKIEDIKKIGLENSEAIKKGTVSALLHVLQFSS